ncbi:MAG: hypothetical protein Greene041679_556 [Parcubacteria group bacterium Greene0416_79]|nr:MAG: hypothetical protein Greene041679_556 [Parcubacteria group bacterium Greene0416_79]
MRILKILTLVCVGVAIVLAWYAVINDYSAPAEILVRVSHHGRHAHMLVPTESPPIPLSVIFAVVGVAIATGMCLVWLGLEGVKRPKTQK